MYIVALYILYIGGKDNVYIFVQRFMSIKFYNIAVDISLFPATQSFFFLFFFTKYKVQGNNKAVCNYIHICGCQFLLILSV